MYRKYFANLTLNICVLLLAIIQFKHDYQFSNSVFQIPDCSSDGRNSPDPIASKTTRTVRKTRKKGN